jgi:hypothetical protein
MELRISKEELISKLRNGDLVYIEHEEDEHTGWQMICGNNDNLAGITTFLDGSHGCLKGALNYSRITKYVSMADLDGYYLANFLHSKDEIYIKSYICDIIYKSAEETELEKVIKELEEKLEDAKNKLGKIRF